MKHDGRVALVTGGANGIGLACVEKLIEEGAKVVIMDRDARTSQDAAARFGGQASAITADLTGLDSTRAAALVKDARKVFNPLDILVNNAGVVRLANFLDIDVADFDLMMDVNVRAPMDIARAVSFLASEDSAYIIGQTIYVDRGRLVLNYTVPESH